MPNNNVLLCVLRRGCGRPGSSCRCRPCGYAARAAMLPIFLLTPNPAVPYTGFQPRNSGVYFCYAPDGCSLAFARVAQRQRNRFVIGRLRVRIPPRAPDATRPQQQQHRGVREGPPGRGSATHRLWRGIGAALDARSEPVAARARVGEWLKPTVCKIVALTGYTGSNPVPGTTKHNVLRGGLQQRRSRLSGKGEPPS